MIRYRHAVQYYETDKMGITHHSNYIRWMEEARVALLEQMGFGYDGLEAMGIASPVMAVECKYKAPTTFADAIDVECGVESFNGVVLRVGYRMFKSDGTLACEGHSEHCFLNEKGRFIRLQRDYPDFHAALIGDIASGPAAESPVSVES